MRGGATLVAALALALLVAGCGGDDGSSPDGGEGETAGGSPELSKQEFIVQADGICAETSAAIANLDVGTAGEDPALQASQEYEFTKGELDQLHSLRPPAQDRPTLDRFFGAMRDEIAVLAQRRDAAQGGDDSTLASSSSELQSAQEDVRSAAEDYGFQDCGQAGKPTIKVRSSPGSASTTPTTTAATTTTIAPTTTTATATTTTPPAEEPPATGGAGSGGAGGGATSSGGGGGSGGTGGVSP